MELQKLISSYTIDAILEWESSNYRIFSDDKPFILRTPKVHILTLITMFEYFDRYYHSFHQQKDDEIVNKFESMLKLINVHSICFMIELFDYTTKIYMKLNRSNLCLSTKDKYLFSIEQQLKYVLKNNTFRVEPCTECLGFEYSPKTDLFNYVILLMIHQYTKL